MPTRSANTMVEVLQKLLTDISQMKTLPDADLEWLVQLETIVVSKIREPIDRLQQQGLTAAQPPEQLPPPGGGGGLPPGVGAPGGGQPPPFAAPGRFTPGPNAPNPDELRRLVEGGG